MTDHVRQSDSCRVGQQGNDVRLGAASGRELWCCDECGEIGLLGDALLHEEKTRHEIRKLTPEERDGVVAIWRGEGREIPWKPR